VKQRKSSKITDKIKVKEDTVRQCFDHFVVPNPLQVLENNEDEDLDSIIRIKKMPKQLLKKCKYCHFKKRSCVLNPSLCSARNLTCFKCDRKGHFPQSICCKINKKSQKLKKIKLPENKSSKPIIKEYFHLIEDRIDQLEKLEKNSNETVTPQSRNYPKYITSDLIPFLTMYILLNFGDMINQESEQSFLRSHVKVKDVRTCILKSAKYCARKFDKVDQTNKDEYFIRYCTRMASNFIQDEPVPSVKEASTMKSILRVYDQMYYHRDVQDESSDRDGFVPLSNHIPQCDGGNDSTLSYDEEIIEKKVLAINCEIDEITCLVNFFRSCNFLWSSMFDHCLCKFDVKQPDNNCFFCHMRSSCLRLNAGRSKGPRSIKLVEFTSQLFQYKNYGWDWRSNRADLVHFIGNTLRVLGKQEPGVLSLLGFPDGQCQQCGKAVKLKRKYIYQVEQSEVVICSKVITIENVLKYLFGKNQYKECCLNSNKFETSTKKYIIFEFSHPIDIDISSSVSLWGRKIQYLSHVGKIAEQNKGSNFTFFRHENKMLYQNDEGSICKSNFGFHKDVKMLSIIFSEDCNALNPQYVKSLVYESQTQKYLQKKYLSVLSPEQHKEKQILLK
jgi:hypothetical protein